MAPATNDQAAGRLAPVPNRRGRTPSETGARAAGGGGAFVKPGTYPWIPFGGGIRRCLGATLAMAEQRVVLRAIARRTDLEAVDPAPERPRHRNVTMVPAHGTGVIVRSRR